MGGRIDITGQCFGKLEVLEYLGDRKYRCKCECGNESIAYRENLKAGRTKSCGCSRLVGMLKHNASIRKYASPKEKAAADNCKYRERYREKVLLKKKEYREANKEKVSKSQRISYEKNRDHYITKAKQSHEKNKVLRLAQINEWAKNNRDKVASYLAANRAKRMQAIPAWGNKEEIAKFYVEAKRISRETGIPHEVDHIVPLCGKNVCGLHWEGNLQVLTMRENISKGNRFNDDLEEFAAAVVFDTDFDEHKQ